MIGIEIPRAEIVNTSRYNGYRSIVKTFLRDMRGLIEKCNVKLRELFAVLFALPGIICIIRIECSVGKHDAWIRAV